MIIVNYLVYDVNIFKRFLKNAEDPEIEINNGCLQLTEIHEHDRNFNWNCVI